MRKELTQWVLQDHRRLNVSAIKELNRLSTWVLWTPFVVSVILLFLLMLIPCAIDFLRNNIIWRKRWTRFRNWLAEVSSGGEFTGVYSHESGQQDIHYNATPRLPSISSDGMTAINLGADRRYSDGGILDEQREKDLLLAERRIPANAKGAWYNLYLVLLPLQVAFITIIIVHNIYTEQYSTESCTSLTTINDNDESIYYECRNYQQIQSIEQILKECNSDNTTQSISCTAYYYNPLLSHIIITILNSLILHLTLARIIVRLIIVMRYLVHKLEKMCPRIFPSKKFAAFTVSLTFSMIVGIVAALYILYGDEHAESGLITDIVFFAFVVIGASIVLFLCGLFQIKLYTPFNKCSYNVTDDPKPRNDRTTSINIDARTDGNDQASKNCFCCSFSTTNPRRNYEEIE